MTPKRLSPRTRRAATVLCMMVAAGCSLMRAPEATRTPMPVETGTPAQALTPTEAIVLDELAFSMPLVQQLTKAGIKVVAVRNSTYEAMFDSTHQAAWIETDKGILDAMFFGQPEEERHLLITQSPEQPEGRFIYRIQAPPPTLLQDRTIDAAYPLYFTEAGGMLIVTSSAELDKALKDMFRGTVP